MKTKRTTRAFFSDNPPTVNVKLPKSWEELSQAELLHVYKIITTLSVEDKESIPFILFRYFACCRVISNKNDSFKCRFVVKTKSGGVRRVLCNISATHLAELLGSWDFFTNPGMIPVRLEFWDGVKAVNAELHGIAFSDYLQIENFYQGFITSHNIDALYGAARLLYPGIDVKSIDEVCIYNILQWLVQIKGMFAHLWPNFFKPASCGSETPSMLEIMNAEIRALTGGDVTKEAEIYQIDCWRALTELDFKAKEAEEFNRIKNKK